MSIGTRFFLCDSIEGRLLKILTKGSNNITSRELSTNQILLFENEIERKAFDIYFENNIMNIDENEIKEKYQHEIQQELNEIGIIRSYSAIHVAIACELYSRWIKGSD